MKIVINNCHGGFGLSPLGQKEYLKLINQEAFFYKQTKYAMRDEFIEYTRIDDWEDKKSLFFHTFTKDFGKKWDGWSSEEYETYSFYCGDIKRNNSNLITVVEKLKKLCNGEYSSLKIVEIPDDVEWTIEEYDGSEWIAEKHRTWQ